MTTPNEGVNDTSIEMDATDMFLSRWQDADDKPSDTDVGKNDQETATGGDEDDATDLDLLNEIEREDAPAEDEGSSDQSEGEDDNNEGESAALEASDDHTVSINVDGEAKTVSVKDLKRLYGQEASLTRKSQEVADARKTAEAEGERYMAAAQKLIAKAEERFAPFAKIDWMVAQQRLKPDEFAALREEARTVYADLEFLKAETNDVLEQTNQARQAQLAEAAKEAITVLEREVPGWNREVYDQVRTFATERGMAPEIVNQIVDPSALIMMHDAMRYRDLKAKAKAKKTTPKAAPKRTVPPSSNAMKNSGSQGTQRQEAMSALKQTGRTEDAVAAFMGGWADQSDN